jgi:hypothetical protein
MIPSGPFSLSRLRRWTGLALLALIAGLSLINAITALIQPPRELLYTYDTTQRESILGPDETHIQALEAVLPRRGEIAVYSSADSREAIWRVFWLQHALAPRILLPNHPGGTAFMLADTRHLPPDLLATSLDGVEEVLLLPNGIAVYRLVQSP